jgi:hypothetical protein
VYERDILSVFRSGVSGAGGGGDTTAALTLANQIPCMCRWLFFAQQLNAVLLMPNGPTAGITGGFNMPKAFDCPRDPATGEYKCRIESVSHPWSIPELWFTTPAFAGTNFYTERATSSDDREWWNEDHVLDQSEYDRNEEYLRTQDPDALSNCQRRGNCWRSVTRRSGNTSIVVKDCTAFAGGACYLQRLGNLSGLDIGCISAKSAREKDLSNLDKRTYQGFYDRFREGGESMEEFLQAMDFRDTDSYKLNATLLYNDTSPFRFGPPYMLRINNPLRALIDSFLNQRLGSTDGQSYSAAMLGVKEMPKIASFLTLDIGASMGPFFFSLAFHVLFPTIVVGLVYDKEQRLRIMMRMMGLGTRAYWTINYIFWVLVYAIFALIFLTVASLVRLPSGYRAGIITKQNYSIHFVLLFLFINHTVSFAILCAALFRSARVSQIVSTLWVLGMCLIAWTAWDSGNLFNSETVPAAVKNLITVVPVWSFYRAWIEYVEYSQQAAYRGTSGLEWSDLSSDPRCGMGPVLVTLVIEWPIFLLTAAYLDAVLDTKHGLPKHPLFFLGYDYDTPPTQGDGTGGGDGAGKIEHLDLEANPGGGGGGMVECMMSDVCEEERRVHRMLAGEVSSDAVVVKEIAKTFPAYLGNPPKVAVRKLSMGVPHGECFGMLGPNGAGKTTTINMLIGFTPPTSGTATVEGLDVRTSMDKIYSLMGVCPQHDLLWETLTPREHLSFYGRLKNLRSV